MTGLSVDADIDATEGLFGMTVSDLQSDIEVDGETISGTLKYVADFSTAFNGEEASGNYIVLHAEVPDVDDVTLSCELVGGIHGPKVLDEDGLVIVRVTDKDSQKLRFVASKDGCETFSKTYTLEGLTLNEE